VRADTIVQTQLLMAQAISAIAEHIEGATGYAITPVTFAQRPAAPARGMIACITDSSVATWGGVIAGGGTNCVLGFYNGANWTVMAA
jgi:hypothetical protein